MTLRLLTVLHIVSGSSVVGDLSESAAAVGSEAGENGGRDGEFSRTWLIEKYAKSRRDTVVQLVKSRSKYLCILEALNVLVIYLPSVLPLPSCWYLRVAIGHLLLHMDALFHFAKLVPIVGIYWQLSSLQSPILHYTRKTYCGISSLLLECFLKRLLKANRGIQFATFVLAVTILVLVPFPDVLGYLNICHSASIEYSNKNLDTLLSECNAIDKQPMWKRRFLREFKSHYEALVASVQQSRRVLAQTLHKPCSAPFLRLHNLDDCCELNCLPILLCQTRRFDEYVYENSPVCAALRRLHAQRRGVQSLDEVRSALGPAFATRAAFNACAFPGRFVRELLRVIPSLRGSAALHSFFCLQSRSLEEVIGDFVFPTLKNLMLFELWHLRTAVVTCDVVMTFKSRDEAGQYAIIGTYELGSNHAYVHVYHGHKWYSIDNGIVQEVSRGCTGNTFLVVYERL